jgi:UDP-N-acetyl-D-mannosaminuronic acid dehydrogenase
VVVVGCGAIGLPLAVAFASRGRAVLGYDIDAGRVEALRAGRPAMVEDGLEATLGEALSDGRIDFTATLLASTAARAFIVAVPTPAGPEGFDDGPLRAALGSIAAVAADGDLVIVRSTTPIGTARALATAHPRLAFAACPDRSLSGRALADQFELPHIVGGVTERAGDAAQALLATLGRTVRVRDADTAEAVKLFANAHRDLVFAEANQFAMVCDAANLDFAEIAAAGADGYPRFTLARPGPVGGPCLTKDIHVLAASPALRETDLGMLLEARRINQSLAPFVCLRIMADLDTLGGAVAILGLAFKGRPAVADRRGAFAGQLASLLRPRGVDVRLWDPGEGPVDSVLEGASVVVFANDHPGLAAIAPRLARGTVLYDMAGLDVRPEGVTPRGPGRLLA